MYRVMVDDNFHFMDERERTTAGDFDTLEAAHERCRKIVENSLDDLHEPGMTAEELREAWGRFGDDPFVRVPPGEPPSTFSAGGYAKRRASENVREITAPLKCAGDHRDPYPTRQPDHRRSLRLRRRSPTTGMERRSLSE